MLTCQCHVNITLQLVSLDVRLEPKGATLYGVCVCMWLCVAVYGRMYLHAVIARFELPSLNHAGDVIGWLAKASFLFFSFFLLLQLTGVSAVRRVKQG